MSPVSRYRNLDDLPGQLPLFPLRGAILLPRTGLPLNVFEPRYLTMLDTVISTNRLLGIIQPKSVDSDEAEESPQDRAAPMKPVGCTGRVTGYQELDDGSAQLQTGTHHGNSLVHTLICQFNQSFCPD